ncbi:MAG: hypothetical protein Q4D12_02490 [Bacteroidales bacterium]|nr:hypothetical protein [Bacteroidales bacterium]
MTQYLLGLVYGWYQKSPDADLYKKIAETHACSPQRVYNLAHGKMAMGVIDSLIVEDLLFNGLIHA